MGERTEYPHGTFSWVELATTDQDAAKGFYSELFGWDYEDSPVGDGITYSMATLRGRYVGAIAPQQTQERDQDVPPHWNSYVTVDDVDAVSGRAAELGGQLWAPPFDVMDVGRMSVLSDPTGAVVFLWQARQHIGAGLVNEPGAFCWNELATRDPKTATEFYSALLGWEFEPSQATAGPAYWMIKNAGGWNAGMREIGDELPPEVPSHWAVYFAVEDVNASAERATAAAGHVLMPRTEIPERGAFAAIADPQGAFFALYEGLLEP
jgi:predicted enzyme related to lactoylglutathione lyase